MTHQALAPFLFPSFPSCVSHARTLSPRFPSEALLLLLLFCCRRCAPGLRVCWSRFIGASLLIRFLCSIALAVVLLSSVDTGFNACCLRCRPLPCCCCCWCRLFSSLWILFKKKNYFDFLPFGRCFVLSCCCKVFLCFSATSIPAWFLFLEPSSMLAET